MKNTRNKVRLTESQLHQVIKESVSKILNEIGVYNQPKRKFDPNRYNGGGRADIEGGLPMNFEHDNDDPSEYRDYFGKHEKICEGWFGDYHKSDDSSDMWKDNDDWKPLISRTGWFGDYHKSDEQGRNAAMGKYKDGAKTYGGVRLNGTGTKNGAFQHYGEDR